MQVPLEWKLSVTGNNQVKSVMSDLSNAFSRGQISGSEYADSMSKIGRESNKVNNISRYQNQIFLSMHPNINKLSRAFSTLSSVARTTLSVITSINTLMIAQNTGNAQSARIISSIAEKQRELNREQDPEKRQKLNEDIAVLNAELKEQTDMKTTEFWNGLGIAMSVVTLTVAAVINILKQFGFTISNLIARLAPSIGGFLGGIQKALSGLGVFLAPAVAFFAQLSNIFANPAMGTNVALWASQFLGLIPGVKELRQGFSDWLNTWGKLDGSFIDTAVMKFFNDLPGVASSAWQAVTIATVTQWNVLIGYIETGINNVLKGFSNFVNVFINGINSIISGINKAFKSNIPMIQPFVIQNISLPKIDTNVGSPAGSSNVGQIGPSNTYITVQGSVITERQLMDLVDNKFKEWMKSRGFTGFQ